MSEEPVTARRARGAAVAELAREDLDLYGEEELRERIEALEAEIARIRRTIDKKSASRQAADAVFSFGGKSS